MWSSSSSFRIHKQTAAGLGARQAAAPGEPQAQQGPWGCSAGSPAPPQVSTQAREVRRRALKRRLHLLVSVRVQCVARACRGGKVDDPEGRIRVQAQQEMENTQAHGQRAWGESRCGGELVRLVGW